MVRDTRPMTITYKGQSSTFDMPGWYSTKCDEAIHDPEDTKAYNAAIKELKIRVENLLPPKEVKRIRESFGLTQRDAGTIIGGGPNAFQKYESGENLVSKGMSNFLRILERHPEEVDELRKQA